MSADEKKNFNFPQIRIARYAKSVLAEYVRERKERGMESASMTDVASTAIIDFIRSNTPKEINS